MVDKINAILGSAPAGFEWMSYVVYAILLLFVCKLVTDVFFSIFKGLMKW